MARRSGITDMATAHAAMTTLAFRLPMLWLAAFDPTPRRMGESRRMMGEKIAAAQMGVFEGQMAFAQSAMKAFWAPWLARDDWFSPWRAAVEASQAPAIRTVKANARRLSKRKTI